MIKKISSRALRPGMYIHGLGRRLGEHPFLLNRFLVRHDSEIRDIVASGITEVYIDTACGADVEPDRATDAARAGAWEREASEAGSESASRDSGGASTGRELEDGLEALGAAMSSPPRLSLEEEFQTAQRVYAETNRIVHEILHDVRLGRQVSVKRTEEVVETLAESILRNPGPLLALSRIKKKDEYTYMHSVSVGTLMMVFCHAAKLGNATVREAGLGGVLHDVGKMTVPNEVLNKEGALTDREFTVIRHHVIAGLALLESTPGITPVAIDIVAEHHERFDGTGYPRNLGGVQISEMGQMAAIVDVYDAITSDRVYHRGVPAAEGVKKIFEWRDSLFNPELVQLLIRSLGIYPTGTVVMLESGRLAVVIEQSDGNLLQPRVRVVHDARKGKFVKPYDLDLARGAARGGPDRIVRYEHPEKWAIDPLAYLMHGPAITSV